MKSLIVLSAVAACASARVGPIRVGDLVGPSGALLDDGKTQVQFTQDGPTPLVTGPSGIIWSDGTLTQRRLKREAQHNIGEGGAILSDGQHIQFTEAGVVPLVQGPSAIIWSNGQVTQLRVKRSNGQMTQKLSKREAQHLVGESGAVLEDGQQVQFTEGGVKPLVEGPSGIIWSNGQVTQKRSKREAQHLVGESGAVLEDGQQVQFTEGGVVPLVEGPAGIIWSNGQLTQKRSKRNAPGSPAYFKPDGTGVQLPAGVFVASSGPSGVVLTNGQNIQF